MQYSFNLALKSLRKYPLPLESAKDCKILKGFGDKLCKMLDDKLKEHKTAKKPNGQNQAKNNVDKTPPANIAKVLPTGNTRNGDSSSKQYIPQYGSGGYGILVTLYKQSLQPDYPGFLRKSEIIDLGKDLVNSSFTKPEPGSRYTAWSSMRTLLTKNLVSKVSHPPKFSLTDNGIILARKLYDSSNMNKDSSSTIQISDDCIIINVSKKNDSEVEVIESCDSGISKSYDVDIPDEFTDGFLDNLCDPVDDTFSVNTEGFFSGDNMNFGNHKTNLGNGFGDEIFNVEIKTNKSVKTPNKIPLQRFASSPSNICLKQSDYQQKPKKTMQKYSSANTISSLTTQNDVEESTNQFSLKKYTLSSSIGSTKSSGTAVESFILAPNSFDIILYVDTQETSGSSNIQNDDILLGLKRLGAKYEVKNLKVGDFTWVCRDRLSEKELILPYIVERKRMDDFAHSIKDRRYYEQKFRLQKSGIENWTYLVESHGRNQHVGLPLQTLIQAATNTAIHEIFSIKFTENIRETVEYLVSFSQVLAAMFKSKTLASCLKDDIQPVDIHSDVIGLMTFKEFNDSSVKNKGMKVNNLFLKMLVQIKGMSPERALAITKKYPTPALLREAYAESSNIDGEKLLSNVKYGKYGKSIGSVLSKTVYQALCRTQ